MSTTQNIKGEHLFLVLYKASKAVETYDNRSIKELGFASISDFAVLEYLKTKGPQPVNTIGQSMMLTSGSITTAIDRAEKNSHVTREHDPNDGRIVNVTLTDKGRDAIDSAFEKHAANLERLFSMLDKEEKIEFARLMKKVGKAAETLNL